LGAKSIAEIPFLGGEYVGLKHSLLKQERLFCKLINDKGPYAEPTGTITDSELADDETIFARVEPKYKIFNSEIGLKFHPETVITSPGLAELGENEEIIGGRGHIKSSPEQSESIPSPQISSAKGFTDADASLQSVLFETYPAGAVHADVVVAKSP
jgi:hypothetical protein